MVTLANLGRLHGDVVERATLSRDLLAPAAARLSPSDDDLHRRCVLAWYIGFFRRPDDVRAGLVAFGDVEAVAVCGILHMAVVVFRTAAGAASALQKQDETETRILGVCSPVPPLQLGFPSCFIQPGLNEVALYPPSVPATTSGGGASSSTKAAAAAERRVVEDAATAWATQPVDSRPAIVFQNALNERPRTWVRGPPGTTEFVPSLESKVNGPRLEADGHLWMDGFKITYYVRKGHANRTYYTLFAPVDFRPMQLER